jgi:FdhD protein
VVAVPVVCAVPAPSRLAVDAVHRVGQTLVGFPRGERFNVYAHPERVDLTR